MNYNTGINWDLFFNQVDLVHNDKPVYVKDFLPNPQNFVSWEDVEIHLNTYQSKWDLIKDNSKLDIPTLPARWGSPNYDKKFIKDYINKGETFVMLNYSMYNSYTKALCQEIENLFPVATDIHVYGSKGSSSTSFPYHFDYPSNFIIQIYGECKWKVYSNSISSLVSNQEHIITPDPKQLNPVIETILKPGDMVYIPSKVYHAAFPNQPRLSLSVSCKPGAHGRINKNYYKL